MEYEFAAGQRQGCTFSTTDYHLIRGGGGHRIVLSNTTLYLSIDMSSTSYFARVVSCHLNSIEAAMSTARGISFWNDRPRKTGYHFLRFFLVVQWLQNSFSFPVAAEVEEQTPPEEAAIRPVSRFADAAEKSSIA